MSKLASMAECDTTLVGCSRIISVRGSVFSLQPLLVEEKLCSLSAECTSLPEVACHRRATPIIRSFPDDGNIHFGSWRWTRRRKLGGLDMLCDLGPGG